MATYHVLELNGKRIKMACHIPAPTGNNVVGNVAGQATISWSQALVITKLTTTTALTDGDGTAGTISATEKAQLATGAVVEVVSSVDLRDDFETLTAAQKATRITEYYNDLKAAVQAQWQVIHRYTGFVGP
jgi:hypothetical protein